MAFAAEDAMHLLVDGQPVNVVTVSPDGWASVGDGSSVQLSAAVHIRVEVQPGHVTHGGRELQRCWNWVPPRADGTQDAAAAWSVVPPWALRPDPAVRIAS